MATAPLAVRAEKNRPDAAATRKQTQHGIAVVAKVRNDYPAVYLRTSATFVPREFCASVQNELADLSDEELADRIIEVAAVLNAERQPKQLPKKCKTLGRSEGREG